MFALMRLGEGLLIAHACLIASFLVGSSAFPWPKQIVVTKPQAMLRLVSLSAIGFAIYGFAIFLLALAGLLSLPFLLAAFVVIVVAGSFLQGDPVTGAAYWTTRFRMFWSAWDLAGLLAYGVALLLAAPAILPNLGGDPISYHLAYAQEWARAGRLVVDPFLRFPFYASNFNLFFATFFVLHAEFFVNFLAWVTLVYIVLGVHASVRIALGVGFWQSLAAAALTLAVVLSPFSLRWMATAYIDLPTGAFAAVQLFCIQLALLERDRRWLIAAAIAAGFLVGMKGSFLVLLPLLGLVLILAGRALQLKRKDLAVVLAILVVCAAPWYARNVVLAGDPFPPLLNVMLYGRDGIITKDEWSNYQHDLRTEQTTEARVLTPFRAFMQPTSLDFREYGTTALILLLYVPLTVLLIGYLLRVRYEPIAWLAVLALTDYVAYWFSTTTLLRYALLFYPVLAVCVALVFAPLLKSAARYPRLSRFVWPLTALLALATLVPSSGSETFYRQNYNNYYRWLTAAYVGDDDYMRRFGQGYVEADYAARLLTRKGLRGRVYVFGLYHAYYFRRYGLVSMGDWSGPAGYFRVAQAVDAGQVLPFLKTLGADAVLIEPGQYPGGLEIPLERQLIAGGFCAFTVPTTHARLLVAYPRGCKNLLSAFGNRWPTFTSSS